MVFLYVQFHPNLEQHLKKRDRSAKLNVNPSHAQGFKISYRFWELRV